MSDEKEKTKTNNPTAHLSPKGEKAKFTSVNWHVWPFCNYKCRFCFGKYPWLKGKSPQHLSQEKGFKLIERLAELGTKKLNFAGGEPMLCPWIGDYLRHAHQLGLMTSIVTNGSKLTPQFLEEYGRYIEWIGLSFDSTREEIEKQLGRGRDNHLSHLKEIVPVIKEQGIKLKLNFTLTRLALHEDLTEFVSKLKPDRFKIFQVLILENVNMDCMDLTVTSLEFEEFVQRHSHLEPVAESNQVMTGSYLMIDSLGHLYQNLDGRYSVSSRSLLDDDPYRLLSEVGFIQERFEQRDGLYFLSTLPLQASSMPSQT